MKYYIVNSEEIEKYTPNMVSSFGHANIFIRKSLDEAFGLMEFTDENTPEAYKDKGFTKDEIIIVMSSAEWSESDLALSGDKV
jgi:hypothetical protein